MGSRRRNLFVLLLVIALMAGSLAVITSKDTVLGLDLRGGTELVYQGRPTPQTPEVTPDAIDRAIEIIRKRTDTLGVSEPEIARVGATEIEVGLPDVQNADDAKKQIGTTSQLYFYDFEGNVVPPPGPNVPKDPSTSPDPDPSVYTFSRFYDAVEYASKQKSECFKNQCTTNGPTYYLFDRNSHLLRAGPTEKKSDLFLNLPHGRQPKGTQILAVPQGLVAVTAESDNPSLSQSNEEISAARAYLLRDRPALSGDDIKNPQQNFDPVTNQPNVTFDFTDAGRTAFQDVTRKLAERGRATAPPGTVASAQADQFSQHFSVVLDNQIVTQPIINFVDNPEGIDGRTGAQISGNFTIGAAQDLAHFLEIGALPIKLVPISESTVSATLGQQALDEGLRAGVIGLALVLLFLVLYYRILGLVAAIGLGVYALFFFALIKLIPITLTLPGIAGLILTIGVAADANIVIFERIKEEARAGRSPLSAIAQGYRKGIATIIDANVITLVTAFILFVLATAGVKGFAFTLGVGTIVSLFTAVLFTHAVLGLLGRTRVLRSPRALGAGEQRVRWNFDFMGASRWFFSFSGVILSIGAIAMATNQLNLGIDFTSGARIQASLEQPATVDQVRNALTAANVENASSAEIQELQDSNFGDNVVQIKGKIPINQASGRVKDALDSEFGLKGGDQGYQNTSVGPTFGSQIARSAVIAIVFSLLVISAYMAIRFEAKFAIPVIIALFHDILITAGVYALTGREVTSGTVAAFLTILGYSMYDTVIVFDRVRENVPRMPRAAFSQVVNRSMSEVLTRSLITGLSTVFLVGVLFLFGGDTLKDFAFAMMVGVASGGYSSIFIASPVLTEWKEREPAYRSRRAQIAEAMGYVPTFPEDNVVARVDEAAAGVTRRGNEEELSPAPAIAPPRPSQAPQTLQPSGIPPEQPLGAPQPPAPAGPVAGDGSDGAGVTPASELPEDHPDRPSRAERQRRRQQRRGRRKHGRNR